MYNSFKTDISEWIGLSKDALHIHIGLALFVLAMLVFRKSPASLVPWLCVLGLELANELKDVFHFARSGVFFDLGDSPKDFINTLFWPTVLMVWFRVAEARKRKAASAAAASKLGPAL